MILTSLPAQSEGRKTRLVFQAAPAEFPMTRGCFCKVIEFVHDFKDDPRRRVFSYKLATI
jgi:hypothetical protein